MIVHPIPPVYDKNSKILILGSFPSVKSREEGFFYGHPSNRFWKVISSLVRRDTPTSKEEKLAILRDSGIALWDVIASCEIVGSSDSSIKNVTANDIRVILENTSLKGIFVNGKTAKKYYDKYIYPSLKIEAYCLPSTSPANAVYSLPRLIKEWESILAFL